MKGIYTTIPIGLIKFAIKNRKLNHLKVYIYLKCTSSGHLRVDSDSHKIWAKEIGISLKTFRGCVSWMLRNKWLSFNSIKSSLRVSSYKQLKRKYKFEFHTSIKFDRENFVDFRAFCAAALIGKCIGSKKFLDKKNKVSGVINGAPRMSTKSYPKNYYDLAIRYFAAYLDVSVTTAENLKKEAQKFGFISVKKNNFYLEVGGIELCPEFMKHIGFNKKHFIKSAKGIIVRGSDLIKLNVHLKRKRWSFK